MKTFLKRAVLTTLGLAAITTAQAQYSSPDLILGFTGGSSFDVLFDIGTAQVVGVGGAPGNTVNLDSSFSPTLLNANGYSSLLNKSFGVIGYTSGVNKGIYSTVPHGFAAPSAVGNQSAYNGISLSIDNTGQFIDGNGNPANSAVVDKTDPNSWNNNVANPGANTFYNNYGPPDSTIVTSPTYLDLYFAPANGSTPNLVGFFQLDPAGHLSFSVPEPTTTALVAVSGLLALVFRRQLIRKA